MDEQKKQSGRKKCICNVIILGSDGVYDVISKIDESGSNFLISNANVCRPFLSGKS